MFAFDQPTVLARRNTTGRDSDGNLIRTESGTVVLGVFDPGGGSSEQTDDKQRVVTSTTVFYPHGTVIGAVDAVVIDPVLDVAGRPTLDDAGRVVGDRYEVNGEPVDWKHPNGWTPGVAVPLKKETG